MTDHKFTDDEIITALKCLSGEEIFCKDCAFARLEDRGFACKKNVANAALDLLHRQKVEIESLKIANEKMYSANKEQEAEIERLEKSLADQFDSYENIRKKAKSEAIKEFAQRLKQKSFYCERTDGKDNFMVLEMDIDTLVKEMTEESK